jgi:hypothetical protein
MSTHNPGSDMEIPSNIAPFVNKCPQLLPGESEPEYFALFDLLMDEIRPDTTTEWLMLADIAGLFWELGRYRAWKGPILKMYRCSALEAALRQTHRSRAVVGDLPALINIARREAEDWRTDPEKRQVLDFRLAEYGYDEATLNAGALLEALVPLTTIERFQSSARGQLNVMLKEVSVRREFADRARKALKEHTRAVVPMPVQIETRQ